MANGKVRILYINPWSILQKRSLTFLIVLNFFLHQTKDNDIHGCITILLPLGNASSIRVSDNDGDMILDDQAWILMSFDLPASSLHNCVSKPQINNDLHNKFYATKLWWVVTSFYIISTYQNYRVVTFSFHRSLPSFIQAVWYPCSNLDVVCLTLIY